MVFLYPCALDKSSHSIERVKKLSKKIEYIQCLFLCIQRNVLGRELGGVYCGLT